ncbi:hypothetical protein GDO86_014639 [Hymenochirus boettgeri]|uniref:Uncharacterized protein n=1 Tax=Hymenochirus boettgeri TaxID=247094 RepID=A0A8T2JVD9_9PIPI|nr:hypothetical protein GDO86_014639 [Hymenochirus boettgeri]
MDCIKCNLSRKITTPMRELTKWWSKQSRPSHSTNHSEGPEQTVLGLVIKTAHNNNLEVRRELLVSSLYSTELESDVNVIQDQLLELKDLHKHPEN